MIFRRSVPAIILFFCLVFPLLGQDQDELARAMRTAINRKDIAAVKSLLDAGADPNGLYNERSGRTFLIEAIDSNRYPIAELLLDRGADPNITANDGKTAAFYGSEERMALLASRGARFDITDMEGSSPLIRRYSNESTALFILQWEEKHSPGFSARFESRKDYLTNILVLLFRMDYFGYGSAAEAYNLTELLLDCGADPAAIHEKGIPVAYFAVTRTSYKQFIIPLLVERGAPLDAFNLEGETMLYCAADNINKELVDFLLGKGADPNQQCVNGKTPLMAARSKAIITSLLAKGADPDIQDEEGETALMKNYEREFIDLLLQAGADPTLKDLKGQTVLHLRLGLLEDGALLDYLISRGCSLDEPDLKGFTPLMNAARREYREAVAALLEKGADPNCRSHEGKSALHLYLLWHEELRLYNREREDESIAIALLAAGTRPAVKDDEGDSALITAMRLSLKHSNFNDLRDIVSQYAGDDEIIAAKAEAARMVAKENRERRHEKAAEALPAAIKIFSIPLLIGGLSVGMREGGYANNFMGPVNGILTLGTAGLFLGALIGANSESTSGSSWSDMFSGLAGALIGGTLGAVAGIITACLPSVSNAFTEYPVLYYAPTVMSFTIATIVFVKR